MTRPASARSAHMTWHARPRVRLEHVPFTGDYPTAKLCTVVDLSNEASPGMAWPKAEAVDIPRRGPHGVGARRCPTSDGW
jgi:hypothetical protein